MPTAAILTIGNELTSGDVADTNGAWLAHRLERIGVTVTILAAVRDEIDAVARFLRREAPDVDFVIVTGGLGGTPDDLTREAVAATFEVAQEMVPKLADALRARFTRDPEYAARWAALPAGSRGLENPLGGAPGFVIENVYVLPGLPAEMRAMFDSVEHEFAGSQPIGSWRRSYRLRESEIVQILVEAGERWPGLLVGSYPSFDEGGPEVEVVLKSQDEAVLSRAAAWVESVLAKAVAIT
jgi:molybdenum cofactor synthesis domain-containing protein